MNTYQIRVLGMVDVEELNPMSPHQMTPVQSDDMTTWFSIFTDQAGMLGMIRQLHNQGFIILSLNCQTEILFKQGNEA